MGGTSDVRSQDISPTGNPVLEEVRISESLKGILLRVPVSVVK
jgi:hypothetical protein